MRKSHHLPGRHKEVKLSRLKRLLQCERLETRQLLASDFGDSKPSGDVLKNDSSSIQRNPKDITQDLRTQKPTHFYAANDLDVGLVVYPKRLAIAFSNDASVDSALLDALKLTYVRKVNDEFSVYDSVNATETLLTNSSVREIVPVFYLPESNSEAVVLDELIVGLKPGVNAVEYFAGNTTFSGYRPLVGTPDQFVGTVASGKGEAALTAANAIESDARLTYVSPNFYQTWQKYYTPNDPRFINQWHLNNTGQGGGLVDADSDLPEAWDVVQGGSPSFVIGVIDDGVASHPDLNLWVNPGEIAGNSIDDDGNGWVDDVNGWNFVSNNNLSGNTDASDAHGTAVAGVAAARGDNALGVSGSSYNSQVISGKMFEGSAVASDANIAAALHYMAGRTANGLGTWRSADLVNNSWGGGGTSAAINAALAWGTTAGRLGRGTPYLFATGNGFGAVSEPAVQSLNIPGVIAIGATNNKGERSNYSNFGPAVDMVTPSNDTRTGYLAIDTTDRVGAAGYAADDYTGTGATGFGGTSSATPLATGIAALTMFRADTLGVTMSPLQLRDMLRNNTDLIGGATYDVETGKNNEFGFGRLNAASAVSNIGKPEISVLTTTADLVNAVSVVTGPTTNLGDYNDFVFRIRNQGTSVLNLGSLAVAAGPFIVLSGFANPVLGIGGSTTFALRFAPTTGGVFTRTVTITSNDADESSFVFDVSATAIAPSIAGNVFEDWDGDNLFDAQDVKLAGRMVYIDANNNGQFDTVPVSYASAASTPITDLTTVTSTITVAGFAGFIADVNVNINITHTWDSDLNVTLISPAGVRVPLFAAVGGNGDNFVNTVLDDEAATAITAGAAPFTGSFRPTGSLALLDQVSANGVWTLEVTDTALGDVGTVNSWRLDMLDGEPSAVTRVSGAYAFLGLQPATYSIRSLPPANWSVVGANLHVVTLASASSSALDRNFATGRNDRFYGQVFDDANGDGDFQSAEAPLANRKIFLDLNGNGTFDAPFITNFLNTNPLSVPDLGTINSNMVVTGVGGPIADINVRVNITMTWNSDLDVFLVHPDGTRVELFTDVGGSSQNFIDTVLDDQAATSITAGSAPYTGSFRPEGSLATLNSKSANGTWRLELTDDLGGDVATLNNWQLIITAGEFELTTSSVGTAFYDLPAGISQMRLAPLAGWINTIPTNGLRIVTPIGSPVFDQRFGTQVNVAPLVVVNSPSVVAVEGTLVSNAGTWGDANAADVVTLTASVGTIVKNSDGTWSWSLAAPDDEPTTSVTVTATDLQGLTTSVNFTYAINNLPPSLTIANSSINGIVFTTITNTGTHGDVPADTVTLSSSHGTIVNHNDGTWTWSITPTSFMLNQVITVTASDEDGGVTTAAFTMSALFSIVIDLPSLTSNNIVIRRSGSDVQVVDLITSTTLFSAPLIEVFAIQVNGSDSQADTVFVDYSSGGFFSLPFGIKVTGQGGTDVLTVTGTGNTAGTHSVATSPVGQRQLATVDSGISNSILFENFETLTFDGLASFKAIGTLDVGSNSLTIGSSTPVDLGSTTLIFGGTLTADRISLQNGESLSGFGTLATKFSGELGSLVSLQGPLSIGDPTSLAGFQTLGNVSVGANTLTLLDTDQAVMGSATTLGTTTPGTISAGAIDASNGVLIPPLAMVTGFGTIKSSNSPSKPSTNSGTIQGLSAAHPIAIEGFLNGTGSIDQVTVTGTISPGFGPANVSFGSVSYAGSVIIDLNGPNAGTQHDQINHLGTATLGGILDVRLDALFVPVPGAVYTLLNASAVIGRFTSVVLPTAPTGQSWEVAYTANSVTLQLVALSLSIQQTTISENGGSATGVIRRSNVDLSQSLLVSLSSSDTTEAALPATVTIPAGQSSTTFTINAVDDNLLDGTQVVSISVRSLGYAGESRSLSVTDYETLSINFDRSSISERNGLAMATVTRSNTDNALPYIVNLSNSDFTELSIPLAVTIPANQASVSFAINAVDDNLLDGTQTVVVGVSEAAYFGSSTSVSVTDYETFDVTYSKMSIGENGETAIATITRSNTELGATVIITLTNSDPTAATLPATVSIPADQYSVSFVITGADDTLLDGTQVLTMSVDAPRYVTGSKALDVTDVELITLTMNKSRISERGGTAIGTVVRGNSDIDLPITVTLFNSDPSEASMPATVTIPANQTSATFTVSGVIDNLLDGTQSVGIVAGSTGYFSDLEYIDVTDAETFSVTFDSSSISENGGTAIGTVTRSNTDSTQAITVSLRGNDPSEATVPNSVTILAGQASATFIVTAVDDNLLDGDQLVTISASASSYFEGSGTITIADAEALVLGINASSISENGGTTTGRVTRSNSNLGQPLTVTVTSSDASEAIAPTLVTIPANERFATFTITAVDDALLDGTQTVSLSVLSAGYAGTSGSLQITDSESLSVTTNSGSINEVGGLAIGTVIRSNTDNSLPLTVILDSSLTSEAVVPASVTIPANATSVTFAITAVDDGLLDGAQTVLFTASATGYSNGTQAIEVTDSAFLSLTFAASSFSENGGSTTVTVTRSNTNIGSPLTVQLLSSDNSEGTVPATITIPANQSSVTFTATAVDDTLLDGTQSVTFTASAAGYINGSRSLDVTDAESLSVSIAANWISENGGTTTGTVTRSNTDITQPLTVTLLSSDPSAATVPANVTIPANQASVSFEILAVDDTLLDGKQTAIVSANAAGYNSETQTLDVTDAESIAIVINSASISEFGGATTGTVTRSNTDIAQPLTVTLHSSDASEVVVATTVTILAGESSATFAITAVDDTLLDGSQSAVISAAAESYTGGSQALSITDFETLSLVFSLGTVSENGGTTIATLTRSNTDMTEPVTVTLLSSDATEATVPVTVIIPANQASASFLVTAVDDTLLDGTQPLTITATANGYSNGTGDLLVNDSEDLSVTLDETSISESGGIANGTVRRSNTDISSPLTVTLTSSDTSEASVPLTVTIPANETSANFVVTGVDDSLLDGSQIATIKATAAGYVGSQRALSVSDAELVSFSISVASISENGGSATGTLTRGNVDIDLPLIVALSSDDTSEAGVPNSVIIPANEFSVTFTIAAVDDTLLDGTRAVIIRASAAGYPTATGNLDVSDAETLTLSLQAISISEDGGLTVATITRNNTDLNLPLEITLASNDVGEASVPSQVTINANQTSATFTILGVDDALLDGIQVVTIAASAVGYVSESETIAIADAETLTLSIESSTISENRGTTLATVTRSNSDNSLPLTIALQSTDTTEVQVPLTVTIPANQASVTFALEAVDDSLLDGTQSAVISASATGYAEASQPVNISDAESLALVVNQTSISERGGQTTATVTRSNSDIGLPLTVTLLSSDGTEAGVPTTVIIPANASSVNFLINAIDDTLLDGLQVVTIQVRAANYSVANAPLSVTDSESILVTIDVSSISEKNGSAIGTVKRENTDITHALVVQLTSDRVTEARVPATVTIPGNQSQVTFTITSVNEFIIDGDQLVQITANAVDYEGGTASLTVLDDDPSFPWHNARNRFDVNNDTFVTPLDALLVINALNAGFVLTPELPTPFTPVRYVDVSRDGVLSPIDALLVINELNRSRAAAEGELPEVEQSSPRSPQSNHFEAVIDLLAEDQRRRARR
jgi:subtilisin-like proprotein convertase family protein